MEKLHQVYNPIVSIVIPTFNESEDIEKTLINCVEIDYLNKEIIVVDDSFDNTPDVVRKYLNRGVRLIKRVKNEGGRCGARNVGILEAKGEIVIILNADVLLPRDFINRIIPHYEAGADAVLVDGKVGNREFLISRYIGCMEDYTHRPEAGDWFNWSEGFSCRRSAAIKSGLFPTPPLVVTAGEDGYFSRMLEKNGYKRVVDRSILIKHMAVYRWLDFWKMSKERVTVIVSYYLDKKSVFRIFLEVVFKSFITPIKIILLFPAFIKAVKISKYSDRGIRDIVPFMIVHSFREMGFLFGKWGSFLKLIRQLLKKNGSK